MNVAILGSTGLLGQALMRAAQCRGVDAIGLARHGANAVDATQPADLRKMLDAVRPGLIVNAAAQVALAACEHNPEAAYLVNAGLPATLTDYCNANGVRLCHISTDHYFTGDGDRLHTEEDEVRILNQYARGKYAGEVFALRCAGSLVIRTNIVGYRGWAGRPTFVEWAIAALSLGGDITLFRDFYTSSISASRLAEVLFDLVERGATGLLNVAAREVSSKADFIGALAHELALSLDNCRVGSVRTLKGVRRAESLGLDVTRAERVLGYELPTASSVIRSLAEDHRSQYHEV
ncbi:NAD(P)-dependent oxidoreductase [Trinickia sp. EG282A]|uniref:NAD(P)-dependent oxidoreductase n=1 Tax=Trinickia sp. EG282A TaxID=3237013 RepID=UPI0034D34603